MYLVVKDILRDFEDKENLLADMENQVDTYREEGKEEAATRLEDQLSLIHTKFQQLSGKFELFQRPSDYDGRLGRITRQLVDLQSNLYLTELISHEPEAIQVGNQDALSHVTGIKQLRISCPLQDYNSTAGLCANKLIFAFLKIIYTF